MHYYKLTTGHGFNTTYLLLESPFKLKTEREIIDFALRYFDSNDFNHGDVRDVSETKEIEYSEYNIRYIE